MNSKFMFPDLVDHEGIAGRLLLVDYLKDKSPVGQAEKPERKLTLPRPGFLKNAMPIELKRRNY